MCVCARGEGDVFFFLLFFNYFFFPSFLFQFSRRAMENNKKKKGLLFFTVFGIQGAVVVLVRSFSDIMGAIVAF